MKKVNPLFSDSTKMSGDTVATKVELKGVKPFEGEILQIRVVEKDGEEQVVDLERQDELLLTGYIILRHQQEFQYQFIFLKESEPIFTSDLKTTRAFYLLEEEIIWPAEEPKAEESQPEAQSAAEPEVQTEPPSEEVVVKSELDEIIDRHAALSEEEVVVAQDHVEGIADQTQPEVPAEPILEEPVQEVVVTSSKDMYKELAQVIHQAAELVKQFNEKDIEDDGTQELLPPRAPDILTQPPVEPSSS